MIVWKHCRDCAESNCEIRIDDEVICDHYKPKPQTNADRIRTMSDEELAEWVWGAETAGRAYGPRGKNAWLDWLKEEVGDG